MVVRIRPSIVACQSIGMHLHVVTDFACSSASISFHCRWPPQGGQRALSVMRYVLFEAILLPTFLNADFSPRADDCRIAKTDAPLAFLHSWFMSCPRLPGAQRNSSPLLTFLNTRTGRGRHRSAPRIMTYLPTMSPLFTGTVQGVCGRVP